MSSVVCVFACGASCVSERVFVWALCVCVNLCGVCAYVSVYVRGVCGGRRVCVWGRGTRAEATGQPSGDGLRAGTQDGRNPEGFSEGRNSAW